MHDSHFCSMVCRAAPVQDHAKGCYPIIRGPTNVLGVGNFREKVANNPICLEHLHTQTRGRQTDWVVLGHIF